MCRRAVSRWLAYSVAVLAGLVFGDEEGNFRGQDKGERCAEPSTLGCGLVLQAFCDAAARCLKLPRGARFAQIQLIGRFVPPRRPYWCER